MSTFGDWEPCYPGVFHSPFPCILNDTSQFRTSIYRVFAGCCFFGILGSFRHGATGQSNGSGPHEDTDPLVRNGENQPGGYLAGGIVLSGVEFAVGVVF